MADSKFTVATQYGAVSIWQSAGTGLPLILLHGNSMSKSAFAKQMESPLAEHYRLVAIDLPGHGDSADAARPSRTYTLPGYADAVLTALKAVGITRAAVLGWSLGGHVALELAARWPEAVGVALCGAPPASPGPGCLNAAFLPHPALPLLAAERLDEAEVLLFARAVFGEPLPAIAPGDIRRTDGRARRILFDSILAGQTADARALVETQPLPIAILDGGGDPFVNHHYLRGIAFACLWGGAIHRVENAGHAPFWQNARAFNRLLLDFMRDMTRRANRQGSRPAIPLERAAAAARCA